MMTDVLRGAKNQRIAKLKLDNVKEYAALTSLERDDVTAIIYWLVDNHYILRTKEQYPTLHPPYEGLHYSEYITVGQLQKLYKYLIE